MLEEHGRLLDRASEGVEDPAEVFAIGLRTTARLAEDHPVIAQVLVRAGLSYLTASGGLAPRAMRDIERAVTAGRFDVATPFLGVVTTTGCLLAYLHVRLQAPERLGHESADELAERLLRMLGMSPAEAHEHRLPAPTCGAGGRITRLTAPRTGGFRDSTAARALLPSEGAGSRRPRPRAIRAKE